MKCHQRKIRDAAMVADPRPVQTSLDGCEVRPCTYEQAEKIILAYEWLGSMPTAGLAFYGLFTPDDEQIGVACFGRGSGSNSGNLCGPVYRDLAICLERGACVHWAHPHAGSFLVAKACRQASKDYGWRIFYGYSDAEAGEIGTIYQACNWLYLGQGAGRTGKSSRLVYTTPEGVEHNSRWWRAHKKRTGITKPEAEARADAEKIGWTVRKQYDKGRYVWFEGGRLDKKRLRKALRYAPQPYPKREI